MRYLTLHLIIAFILISCATRKPAMTASAELKKDTSRHTDAFLTSLLATNRELDSVLKHNDQWQVKIIYTRVDRDKKNRPRFTNYFFNIRPEQYFYPASTVKMPVSILALQKLNELDIRGLDKNTTMITGEDFPGQTAVFNDPQSRDGRPTIASDIKKIFLVSDNDAFNRLYEFLGQEYCNRALHQLGFDSVQILHRLQIPLTEEQNRRTNPVSFYDTASKVIYQQPLVTSQLNYQLRNTFLGKGYMSNGQLVNSPFDFSRKNRIGLADLHSMLQTVIFPEATQPRQRFRLTEEDYQFLYRYMSMKPGESDFPQYDPSFNGAYSKFLMYGGKGDLETSTRSFSKQGDAYGFLTDVAYIVDFKNGVEFFLSANIYCNSDGIFNDDKYDYEKTGKPFLKNLGRLFYEYELQRKKERAPDLSKFRIDY